MRWLLVAILVYVCLVLETAVFRPGGLAVEIDGHWARPDLVLVIGLFLALFFEPAETFVAGWCMGLASDLVSVAGRLGVKAMLFCLALLAVSYVKNAIPRMRIWVQIALVLVSVLGVHWAWYVATRLLASGEPWVFRSAEEAILDALYSAVLAPYIFWGLLMLRTPLGVPYGTTSLRI